MPFCVSLYGERERERDDYVYIQSQRGRGGEGEGILPRATTFIVMTVHNPGRSGRPAFYLVPLRLPKPHVFRPFVPEMNDLKVLIVFCGMAILYCFNHSESRFTTHVGSEPHFRESKCKNHPQRRTTPARPPRLGEGGVRLAR